MIRVFILASLAALAAHPGPADIAPPSIITGGADLSASDSINGKPLTIEMAWEEVRPPSLRIAQPRQGVFGMKNPGDEDWSSRSGSRTRRSSTFGISKSASTAARPRRNAACTGHGTGRGSAGLLPRMALLAHDVPETQRMRVEVSYWLPTGRSSWGWYDALPGD